ncbi:hypothetical protein PHMEG_00013172 [Phytophthora megakarya]|uniref:Integrase catalytic domain-containing protein n=1 Tax=Phytophthora megakarya TaxID=4795 RepID=A0A225W7C3_9STRA|nr:hypothetical protein PHMEG_00013172 [Phytophthora megakarya]
MSRVFRRFSQMMGIQQQATLAYRPQVNGQREQLGQTIMRSIKVYVKEPDQTDWENHAKRLMHALNTLFDATILDTPFYLFHGFYYRSTISSMLGPKPTDVVERTAYEWRRKLLRGYSYAHACAETLRRRSNTQKGNALSDHLKSRFEVGDSVCLYIPNVLPALSRKLSHLWHGSVRIEQVRDDFKMTLKVQGTGYRVEPWVHITRMKPRSSFPKRPVLKDNVSENDGVDAALTKSRRNAERSREYLVKWIGYENLQWLPVPQLNCCSPLYNLNPTARTKVGFTTVQSGNDDYGEL